MVECDTSHELKPLTIPNRRRSEMAKPMVPPKPRYPNPRNPDQHNSNNRDGTPTNISGQKEGLLNETAKELSGWAGNPIPGVAHYYEERLRELSTQFGVG